MSLKIARENSEFSLRQEAGGKGAKLPVNCQGRFGIYFGSRAVKEEFLQCQHRHITVHSVAIKFV